MPAARLWAQDAKLTTTSLNSPAWMEACLLLSIWVLGTLSALTIPALPHLGSAPASVS